MWLIAAAVLAMAGYDLLLRGWLGEFGWVPIGAGIGILCSVLGSYGYDLLGGAGKRV